jgi:hypothetical protein
VPVNIIGGDFILSLAARPTGNPVNGGIARGRNNWKITRDMNSILRFASGLISTLLLAVGFVRAADRFDPTTHNLEFSNGYDSLAAAPPCVEPCNMVVDAT